MYKNFQTYVDGEKSNMKGYNNGMKMKMAEES